MTARCGVSVTVIIFLCLNVMNWLPRLGVLSERSLITWTCLWFLTTTYARLLSNITKMTIGYYPNIDASTLTHWSLSICSKDDTTFVWIKNSTLQVYFVAGSTFSTHRACLVEQCFSKQLTRNSTCSVAVRWCSGRNGCGSTGSGRNRCTGRLQWRKITGWCWSVTEKMSC